MTTETESTKRETYSRYLFAMTSLVSSFYYLYQLDVVNPTVVIATFSFLSAVSIGFGISKATEYWDKSDDDEKVNWFFRHTRIKFAITSVIGSFVYLVLLDSPSPTIEQAVFGFLGTVALGFGASKATQHLNIKK